MTEHQIQAAERQRQHLVAQSDRERRMAALEAACVYEVEAHSKTKADRDFWLKTAEAETKRANELAVKLAQAEEELKAARKWERCEPVKVSGMTLYADIDEDTGDLLALVSKPGESVEDLLDIRQLDNVLCQIEAILEEAAS